MCRSGQLWTVGLEFRSFQCSPLNLFITKFVKEALQKVQLSYHVRSISNHCYIPIDEGLVQNQ